MNVDVEPFHLWSRYLKPEKRAYGKPDCQVELGVALGMNLTEIPFAGQLRLFQTLLHDPYQNELVVELEDLKS